MNSLTVDNLGKCYHIRIDRERRTRRRFRQWLGYLRDKLSGKSSTASSSLGPRTKAFWALRKASFSVQKGTVLGVIGANGAGKSTLLKILSRVIKPTEGRAVGSGRVVSLLELGAGFNPEVAAHENIFMNAAMYGIPRAEVRQHLEEIIKFAEIEEFIDTPLKFYSSGMYLRLAFSVAINMKPDILLADEILAVGDMSFKRRCLDRVSELSANGLTVLFVSHDMEAIAQICNSVLWLHAGEIKEIGDPDTVIAAYQNAAWAHSDAALSERGRFRNKFAELIGARLMSSMGKDIGAAPTSEDVYVRIRFRVDRAPLTVRCGFDLYRRRQLIFRSVEPVKNVCDEPGLYEGLGRIPADLLSEINYTIHAFLLVESGNRTSSLIIYGAVSFMGYATVDKKLDATVRKGGMLSPKLDWTQKAVAEASPETHV